MLKLWYDCFERELATPVDALQQFIFDRGTQIGLLAQERYPGGKTIEAKHYELGRALRQTKEAMLDQGATALFEPAFVFNDVSARVDVLVRAPNNQWDLIEVKSATRAKDVYLQDLAIQLWILRGTGVAVRRAGLLLLNREYVYDGEHLDLDQLFNFVDLTDEALSLEGEVETLVASLQAVLSQPEPPAIAPGAHCSTPYNCQYYAHCTRDSVFLEHPVEELPRIQAGRLQELAAYGAAEIHEIPDDFPLNELQGRVRDAVVSRSEYVSDQLGDLLAEVSFPVSHLDFETFMPAIPIHVGTRPFDSVPFQYSIHRESEDGSVRHLEYLHTDTAEPYRELAERLLVDLGERGSICVYSSYEKTVLNALGRRLPDLADALDRLVARLWDLLPVVRNHYYHPEFHGSFSIKSVLPVLVPELSYSGMEIGDGMAAASMYELARRSDDDETRQKIYEDLRIYCARDTEAMMALRHALAGRVR